MAVSYLLQINGVAGESPDPKYPDHLEIENFSFGQRQSGTISGSGLSGGKITADDFVFSKHCDKSSPKLFEKCATGEHIDSASLICRRSGASTGELEVYLRIDFKDLILSNFQTSGSNGDSGLPSESISFNYGSHEINYIPREKGVGQGNLKAGYDFTKNISTG